MSAGSLITAGLKWNPLTAAPYALVDHFGGVEAVKKAINGSIDAPQTPTLPPSAPDTAAAAANAATAARAASAMQRKRAALAPGRSSTILTGPSGLTSAPLTGYKTLLGS